MRLLLALTLLTTPALAAPNILWITSEDNGQQIGAYGDDYADTPNIDALAEKGCRYETCWSNAPVCAPARTAIISGLYPTALGGQHMRSDVKLPSDIRMYPQILREAGYYCTNNSKEDYNLTKPGSVWNESSRKAHWKNRPAGTPFFAIFNITISHESQLRKRPHTQVHDPANVRVPAYHPDTPEVRQDWAQYYDKMTEMDQQVGTRLKELEEAGLADETIVFYYGDHGSGMPRSKRWPFDSGLRVPLVVYVPPKYRDMVGDGYVHAGVSDRLTAFVDLAPTALSLAGVKPPKTMQGQAFLGKHAAEPKPYLHGFRGRMDERYDMVRSVTDGRYVYMRHFMPHRIYGQHVGYMFITPTTRVWKKLYDAGKLNEAQAAFWEEKPSEQLFDLKTDPDETVNLIGSEQHQEIAAKMRAEVKRHALEIRDVGFLPEPMMLERSQGRTPYELGHDPEAYPLEEIYAAADQATLRDSDIDAEWMAEHLSHSDAAVRYWAAVAAVIRPELAQQSQKQLVAALGDTSGPVRVAAAEALLSQNEALQALAYQTLYELSDPRRAGQMVALMAINVIDLQEDAPQGVIESVLKLPGKSDDIPGRYREYVNRVRDHLKQR